MCVSQAHVQRLEGQVKEQEVYHVELQEVERWLLQMSSRMVTPDPAAGGGLEAATQQLASHKVTNQTVLLITLIQWLFQSIFILFAIKKPS